MSKSILIVEDEHLIAYLMSQYILEHTNYKVLGPVDNSADAIRLAMSERPDCILMDIRIEGEMDGIDTAKAINAVFNVSVIFTSGNSDVITMERASEVRVVDYLIKPIRKQQLLEALDKL